MGRWKPKLKLKTNLDFGSRHPIQHKQSVVINTLLDRMKTISWTNVGKCQDHKHVLKVLAHNIVILSAFFRYVIPKLLGCFCIIIVGFPTTLAT